MKNLVLAFVLTAAVAALLAIFVFRSRDFAVIAALTGLAGLLVWDLEVWSWFSTKATVAEVEETGFSPMTASVLAVELSGLDLTDHGRKVTGQLIMPVAFVAPAPQAIAPAAIEVATVVEVAAPGSTAHERCCYSFDCLSLCKTSWVFQR